MTTRKYSFIDDMAIQAMMKQHKANDYLVLDDDILKAALENSRPLYRSEWQALLDSPLTLRRMQVLANLRNKKLSSVRPLTVREAANDHLWSCSAGLLRAADSGAAAPVLTTEDGFWQLLFLKSTSGWRMVLKLDLDSAPFAQELLKELPELAVLDGHKQAVLVASLDEDGEVTGTWPLPTDPYAHFMAHGGKFDVVRV